MKMLYAKFQAISMNIIASIFLSSNFLKHFLSKCTPEILDFASQISKMTILAKKVTGNQESTF